MEQFNKVNIVSGSFKDTLILVQAYLDFNYDKHIIINEPENDVNFTHIISYVEDILIENILNYKKIIIITESLFVVRAVEMVMQYLKMVDKLNYYFIDEHNTEFKSCNNDFLYSKFANIFQQLDDYNLVRNNKLETFKLIMNNKEG